MKNSIDNELKNIKVLLFECLKLLSQENVKGRANSYAATAGDQSDSEINSRETVFLYSQEEIKRMPKLKDGRFRITRDGLWQVRYRRDGYDIQFTSKQKQIVVDKFHDWVKSINDDKKTALPKKSQKFSEFAKQYFLYVKKPNVEKGTYETQYKCLQTHILPTFGEYSFRQITPLKCQELLNGILIVGKGRTAETVKFILGEIFRAAIGEKLITDNPMKYVKIPKHQRKNGTALTVEEVRQFLQACKKSPYQKIFAVFLYTGIRRNEIHSAVFDDKFITVACGKTHKGQIQKFRKIPIAPDLRPFLPLSGKELTVKNDVLTGSFKKLCPNHHLYDLRHTFSTHAQECGIPKALVDVWTGHSSNGDMTLSVYTHFSDTFQLTEIEKLKF